MDYDRGPPPYRQSIHVGLIPLNLVGTFRSVGAKLWLAPDEKVFYLLSPKRTQCLIIGFSPYEETVPAEDEIGQVETELYFEHCAKNGLPQGGVLFKRAST